MYAIVEIHGQQLKVTKGQYLEVGNTPRVGLCPGDTVTWDKVLFVETEHGLHIGNPTVPGAQVKGHLLRYFQTPKVIVFKKKRRKGYKKRQGYREAYERILIDDILTTDEHGT